MKKTCILFTALLLTAALLSGCRRNTMLPVTAETTVPLNTVRPLPPTTEPAETLRPAETIPQATAAQPESTIEDGNGPIPSQIEKRSF